MSNRTCAFYLRWAVLYILSSFLMYDWKVAYPAIGGRVEPGKFIQMRNLFGQAISRGPDMDQLGTPESVFESHVVTTVRSSTHDDSSGLASC